MIHVQVQELRPRGHLRGRQEGDDADPRHRGAGVPVVEAPRFPRHGREDRLRARSERFRDGLPCLALLHLPERVEPLEREGRRRGEGGRVAMLDRLRRDEEDRCIWVRFYRQWDNWYYRWTVPSVGASAVQDAGNGYRPRGVV